MLARHDLSATALREALRRAGLPDDQVEAELDAAVRLGALDERRSARTRARALVLAGGWPREAMHVRLVQKGYPPGLAEEALSEVIRDERWDVRAAARRAVVPGEAPGRSARRLLSRGFDPTLVRELLPGVEGMDEGG